MKKIIVAILILLHFSCQQHNPKSRDLKDYLPENSAAILQIPHFKEFLQDLDKPELLNRNKTALRGALTEKLSFLKHLDSIDNVLISFSVMDNKFDYLLISEKKPALRGLEKIKEKTAETIKGSEEIRKYTLDGKVTFTHETERAFLASNSLEFLNNSLNKDYTIKDETLRRALAVTDRQKTSFLFNHNYGEELFQQLLGIPAVWSNNFAEWSIVDLEFEENAIKINGISVSSNEIKSLQKLFNDTGLSPNEIAKVTPSSAGSFSSFSFQDFEVLKKNLRTHQSDSLKFPNTDILSKAKEIGMIHSKNGKSFVINSGDIELTREALADQDEIKEEFRGINIYNFNQPDRFSLILKPLLEVKDLQFYTILEHFVIFSKDLDQLENIIADFQNKNTLQEQEFYQQTIGKLSSESSILFVANIPEFLPSFSEKVSAKIQQKLREFKPGKHRIAAIQFIQQDDFAHIHGLIKKSEAPLNGSRKINQVLSLKLENPVASSPFLFKNHLNDQMDIAVQDEQNILYLISNKGNIYWKKHLPGRILGELHQVDLFKNGKYQLAFNTQNSIQVIDRNGNRVKPFPLEFRDEITQPLSLFDYDHNRKYRFLITQDSEVFMYNGDGRSVRGFEFRKAGSEIIQPPKHIRLGNKDYILVPETSGKLNILSRRGNIRVAVKDEVEFTDNFWYGNNTFFISTDTSGNLIRIDQNGKLDKENLALAENHKLAATSGLRVILNENILNINDKEIELDFGLYTKPQIFTYNDRNHIAITDTQSQRVFIFDKNGKLLPGFPVYGTSAIDIGNADIDRRPEFVVKGEDNELLLYKF